MLSSTFQSAYHAGLPIPEQASDLSSSPPSPAYLIYIPATLVIGAALSWIISGSDGLALGSLIGAGVGLFSLWDWLFRRAPTRVSTLLGMALLLGYGVGSLNTWFTFPRGSMTLGELWGVGPGGLARGIAAVLLAAAPLYSLGELFEKPLFPRTFRLTITSQTRSLVYFGTIVILIGYFTHIIVFAGIAVAGGHVNIPALFLVWLYPPLTALAAAAFITAKQRRDRLLGGGATLILFMLGTVQGRRSLMYAAVEILFVLGLTGFRWRGNSVRNAILIVALGAVIVLNALVFMLLRIAPVNGGTQNQNIASKFEGARKLVKRGDAVSIAVQATRSNVASRTFILAFLANILNASSTRTPAMGRDALNLLESTIPSVIYPGKPRSFSEEELVDQQYGFGYGDQANSILTGGATDFGLLGVLLYPLLLVVLARAVYAVATMILKPLPLLIVALAYVNLFLGTEVILSGYFADIRNSILFGLVIQAFLMLANVRFRRPDF